MDWEDIVPLRKLSRAEIKWAVNDISWQMFRVCLKGECLEKKYFELRKWKRQASNPRKAEVQIINYINALKRGGLIK